MQKMQKNAKKHQICSKILEENWVLSLHQNIGWVFYYQNEQPVFSKFCCKIVTFLHFFSFSAQKTLKIKISTNPAVVA